MAFKGFDWEHYQPTATAIGLIELLGNTQPSTKQVHLAERLVRYLTLSWDDCLSEKTLSLALNKRTACKATQ